MRRKGTAVSTLEQWLFNSGPAYAERLEAQADPLCRSVTTLMMTAYPDLCYLPNRPDAATFQQRAFTETPRRFHRLMQVVLQLQSLSVVEYEYRWGWPVLQRFGVGAVHLLTHSRWYFENARRLAPSGPNDQPYVLALESRVHGIIETVVMQPIDQRNALGQLSRRNGHSRNGHSQNGLHER